MSIQHQILSCEEQLVQAMRDGDIRRLDQLIDDDLLFTSHLGYLVTKQQDLDAYSSGALKMEKVSVLDVHVREHHDTAVVSTLLALKGSFSGQSFEQEVRFTRFWKQKGSWKIIGGSSVAVQPLP